MSETPRALTVLVLVAIAAGLWLVSSHLNDSSTTEGEESPVERGSAGGGQGAPTEVAAAPGPSLERIAGCVTDPAGAALEGAEIRLGPQEARTDRHGRFVLPRLPGALVVTKEGYFPLRVDPPRRPRAIAGEEDELPLVLFPGCSVRGRVADPGGAGIAEAEVFLIQEPGGATERVVSEAGGAWAAPLLPPGRVQVLVRHRDFQTADRTLFLAAPGEAATWDTTLEPGAPLAVKVQDLDGRPLSDADVWLELDPLPGERTGVDARYLGRTGDLGSLRVHRDPERRAGLRVLLAGFRQQSCDVEGEEVQVRLRPAPAIRAQAVSAGTGLPVKPSSVEIEVRDGEEFRTAPRRGLLFHPLAEGKIVGGLSPLPGAYRLIVAAPGGLRGISAEIAFDGERDPPRTIVRLEARPRLRGSVQSGGQAVAGAEVRLLKAADDEPRFSFLHGVKVPAPPFALLRIQSGDEGTFVFDPSVPSGTFRISVRQEGFAEFLSAPFPFPLPETADFPVALERSGSIAGRVIGPDGLELAGVPLVLTGRRILPRAAWTDADGLFRFEALPAALDYAIEVGDPAGALRSVSAGGESEAGDAPSEPGLAARDIEVVPDSEARVELRSETYTHGLLEVRVRIDGVPRACELRIVSLSAEGADLRVECGAGGAVLLRAILPGTYRVVGVSIPLSREVEVKAGERASLDVDLRTVALEVEAVSTGSDALIENGGSVELIRLDGEGGEVASGGLGAPRRDPAEVAARRSSPLSGGKARIAELFPGEYRLRVEAPEHVPLERTIVLESDQTLRVPLSRGTIVRLRLETPSGEEFHGLADVLLLEGETRIFHDRRIIRGQLELPPLPRGEYSLTVRGGEHVFRERISIQPVETERRSESP